MTESRRIDRLHKIQELLGRRRIVYRSELLEKFGISRATLNRDLAELRNRYQVPIDFNQEYGGY
ncbi:HTH domain-containing protein, partial [Accumulibacter sp.]